MSLVVPGATYDGTSLVTTSGGQPRFLFWCERGLDDSPEVRGKDTVIPSAAGRVARNRVLDRHIIELQGHVFGCGETDAAQLGDLRDALEELRTLFDATRDPATLVLDLEDGRTATIEARPMNMLTSPPDVPVYRRVSVQLEAVEGTWVIGS